MAVAPIRCCAACSAFSRLIRVKRVFTYLAWGAVAVAAAFCLAGIAINRGEPINSIWLVVAAACTYVLGFRFYGKFIAARVMALNDKRATPAERLRDGIDFEPTNKWIVLGHHFAAIAGPGPLVGPVLAAQFGYLPGTLWIIIGAVLGGAVQDFVILFASMRRDGKSLGQMAREEIGKVGGFTALVTVLLIMIILLAVVALVVVNALKGSPWGTFTIAATMPIAVFMGLYLRYWRPGKVLECSVIGFVLVMASIFLGQSVSQSPTLAPWFTLSGMALAAAIIVYGFLASALPVWLLLAPRDYLSTFVKLGVLLLLAVAILFVRPQLQLARSHALCRRQRTHLRRQDLPVLLHHHRLRRDLRLSLADLVRHDAENDRERMARVAGRLRLDAARKLRGRHGHDRGLGDAAWRLLRSKLAGRHCGRDSRRSGRHHHRLGISGHARGDADAGPQRGRADAVLPHRRRALASAGHGAYFRAQRRRPSANRLLVSLRHHVRSALHSDHHRCRHAGRPLHAAGPRRTRV